MSRTVLGSRELAVRIGLGYQSIWTNAQRPRFTTRLCAVVVEVVAGGIGTGISVIPSATGLRQPWHPLRPRSLRLGRSKFVLGGLRRYSKSGLPAVARPGHGLRPIGAMREWLMTLRAPCLLARRWNTRGKAFAVPRASISARRRRECP